MRPSISLSSWRFRTLAKSLDFVFFTTELQALLANRRGNRGHRRGRGAGRRFRNDVHQWHRIQAGTYYFAQLLRPNLPAEVFLERSFKGCFGICGDVWAEHPT